MNHSITKNPQPGSPDDHTDVFLMWNSDEMKKRLEDARVKRAKIIAARQTEMSDLVGQQGSAVKTVSKSPAAVSTALRVADDASEPPLASPANSLPGAQKTLQVEQKRRRRSRGSGLVVGLVFGMALGAGTMWISENGLSGFFTAIDTFNAMTGGNAVAKSRVAVDSVPSVQAVAEEAVPANPQGDLPLPAPPNSVRIAANAPADEIGRQISLDPSSERQTMPLTADQVPVRRQQSTSSITTVLTDDQLPSDTADQTAPDPSEDVPSLVVLHLSPDVSQRVYDNIQSTLDTAGLDVTETSIAGFAVLESEVRYFHQSDAQAAQRIADEMRIKVRDFSTFRPTPEQGTLEVWLAGDG